MGNFSIWERGSMDYDCDVAIIGGGFTGSYAAYFLSEENKNIKISIFEKSALPVGASTRNAGFACFGSPSESLAVARRHSNLELAEIIQMRYNGLQLMRGTLGDAAIDYKPCGGYEVFFKGDRNRFEDCLASLTRLNTICYDKLGLECTFSVVDNAPTIFTHAIYNQYEGSINPAKALNRLHELCKANGVQILRGVEANEMKAEKSYATLILNDEYKVRAKRIIIATNGYTQESLLDLDIRPARNSVLITKPIDNLSFDGCYHYNEGYVYFRNIGKRILLGGGRNMDYDHEFSMDNSHNKIIQDYLTDFLLSRILVGGDSSIIDYWWTGIMGVGNILKPLVHWQHDLILYGIRLNGMGVALSSSLGKRLALEINESI